MKHSYKEKRREKRKTRKKRSRKEFEEDIDRELEWNQRNLLEGWTETKEIIIGAANQRPMSWSYRPRNLNL